jgi:hypothetical protein
MRIWEYENMRIWEYENMWIWEYENMRIWIHFRVFTKKRARVSLNDSLL